MSEKFSKKKRIYLNLIFSTCIESEILKKIGIENDEFGEYQQYASDEGFFSLLRNWSILWRSKRDFF